MISLRGKRILVTGAAGFIGSHLVRKLIEQDGHVIALVRPSSDLWRIQDVLAKIEIHRSDLNDISVDALKEKIKGVDIVYHLGAAGVDQSGRDAASIMRVNVVGTLSLLQLARDLNAARFVYSGSCFEYGAGSRLREDACPAPPNEYAVSKLSAGMLVDMFFRKYGLATVYLRPFTVYGPFESWQRLVPHVIRGAFDGHDIKLTGGKQTRDMVFIDDAVEGFLAAGTKLKIAGNTFNLSTGDEMSVKEISLIIVKLMGDCVKILFGAQPYRESEVWSLSGDPAKAKKILGWKARTSLREGLQKTIQWFKENKEKYPVAVAR